MRFRYRIHAANLGHVRIAPESVDAKSESSGANSQDRSLFSMNIRYQESLAREIGEFFRKKRARQDSNLRPPA
jgi:hypothetical protein